MLQIRRSAIELGKRPQNLTYEIWKWLVLNRDLLFQGAIFRGIMFNFRGVLYPSIYKVLIDLRRCRISAINSTISKILKFYCFIFKISFYLQGPRPPKKKGSYATRTKKRARTVRRSCERSHARSKALWKCHGLKHWCLLVAEVLFASCCLEGSDLGAWGPEEVIFFQSLHNRERFGTTQKGFDQHVLVLGNPATSTKKIAMLRFDPFYPYLGYSSQLVSI